MLNLSNLVPDHPAMIEVCFSQAEVRLVMGLVQAVWDLVRAELWLLEDRAKSAALERLEGLHLALLRYLGLVL